MLESSKYKKDVEVLFQLAGSEVKHEMYYILDKFHGHSIWADG
jgi:hypothetical protein